LPIFATSGHANNYAEPREHKGLLKNPDVNDNKTKSSI
jgi:hypothetical protein